MPILGIPGGIGKNWHKSEKIGLPCYGQKTYALYGIFGIFRDFLAHKLAKYQYFHRDNVYSFSTVNLHIICLFQLNIS